MTDDRGAFSTAADDVAAGRQTAHDAAARLVEQLTLAEQLDCLDGDLDAWPGLFAMMAGSYHQRTFPAAVVERFGVPGIQFSDGPRGCVIGVKTAFPVSMARGATFDPDLEQRIGRAIGAEVRTVGGTYYGGVCVNLLRHPGWGRAQETYGEEPMLVGEMGRALMLGAQHHVMACVKHFAVNSMENARFTVDVSVDDRALHEVYLPHFRRIVQSGVASVMSAYNSMNGAYCGENTELLTGILRDEWGFDGFVTSDFIFGLRDAVGSVLAGLDIEMPFRQQRAMHLPDAVADGRLPADVVAATVTRIIATLLRFAPILAREVDPAVANGPEHRALAREAATASIVLLRNDKALLPLDAGSLRRVAIVGRLAAVANLGDRGSSDVVARDVVTPLDGLRLAMPGAQVDHDDRDASIAEGADVAIVVVGFTHADEGEYIDASGTAGLMGTLFPEMSDTDRAAIAAAAPRPAPADHDTAATEGGPEGFDASGFAPGGDRRRLTLSSDDEALIRSTVAVNPRTIVVVMGGSATVMEAWRSLVPAIVVLWYPGVEGGHALADVLLGAASPSGRLPFSIPTEAAHLPHWDPDATSEVYDLWHGHWKLSRDGHEPAFPFGFGLSYTTFELARFEVHAGAQLAVVDVTNTGGRDAHAVVQIYGGVPGSAFERPAQRLVGFRRVHVPAGCTETVEIALDLSQLSVRIAGGWLDEGGVYRFAAAQHVGDPASLHVDVDLPERRFARH
jgi:beta-glucosidase